METTLQKNAIQDSEGNEKNGHQGPDPNKKR
jgi:hypothetical protein